MKKLFAILLAAMLLLSACTPTESPSETVDESEILSVIEKQQAKIDELENRTEELDYLMKKEYLNKYIKPLILSHALAKDWETPEQLFNSESPMVGFFMESCLPSAVWKEIFNEGFVKDPYTVYIPQDIAEAVVEEYFGIYPEKLRELSGKYYNAEKKAYEYYGTRDWGTEIAAIKEIRSTDNLIIITCEFVFEEGTCGSELMIEVRSDGTFKYVSNRLI